MIRYEIPVAGKVNLKIFDIIGREVAAFVNQEQQSGNHLFDFNAGKLSSGVYFYTLESGSFVQTKKMMLLKYWSL